MPGQPTTSHFLCGSSTKLEMFIDGIDDIGLTFDCEGGSDAPQTGRRQRRRRLSTHHALWAAFIIAYRCDALSTIHRPRRPTNRRCATISMGLEVKIRMVGRKNGGEKWLESAYSTYDTRLRPTNLNVSTQYHKNDVELVRGIEADEEKNHKVVLLDPLGKLCTSEIFSEDMYRWLEEGGSRLTFVIGGAEGLPYAVKQGGRNRDMLSMGMMTFTHQFARLLLMEQIYRASEIKKGSGYHK